MFPKQVLQLWRERWDKAEDGLANRPYKLGAIHMALSKLPSAAVWEFPAAKPLLLLISFSFFYFVLQIQFSLNGQITYAGLLVLLVLAVRPFAGSLFTLIVFLLSLIICSQYFHWRYSQTLVLSGMPSLLASLAVSTLEMAVATYVLVKTSNRLWPIRAPEVSMSEPKKSYPEVDVLVHLDALDEPSALVFIEQCLQWDWPDNKCELYFVESQERISVMGVLEELQANVLDAPGQLYEAGRDLASDIDLTLSIGTGEFLLVLAPQESPDIQVPPDLLKRLLGWFFAKSGLALLYTEKHPLSPLSLSSLGYRTTQKVNLVHKPTFEFALLRRSTWMQSRGLQGESLERTVKRLRRQSALSIQTTDLDAGTTYHLEASALKTRSESQYWRVDRADSGLAQGLKRLLLSFEAMLDFYKPVLAWVLLTLPTVTLLIDLPVIKTTSGWLFAMAIPYLTSLAVLGERNEPIRRWGLLKAIQESLLSVYLSVLTAFSFLRASFQNPRLFFVCSFSRCAEPDGNRFALVKSIAVYGLFILNAAALLGFVSDVLSAGPVLSQISFVSKGFFALLAVANLIMLLANQAISHEARHIQAFLVQQKRLKATLVLDSGRTIACVTRNFPRLDLEIGVEAQGALTAAVFNQERCLLQLHHHNLPFNLLVKLEKVDGPLVSLQLLEASQSDFAALKDAVLSRGTDWPAWLPKKAADRVLPVWLADWFANVPSLLIDYSIKLTGMLRISHLLELIRR